MRKMIMVLLLLAFSVPSSLYAQCPPPEWACPFFGDYLELSCTFNGNGCVGKECKGSNGGEEFKVVPTGKYYSTWVTMHDGAISVAGYDRPCSLTVRPGVTLVDIPGNETACAFSLITETAIYMEHFVSNDDLSCYAWLECPCELP